MLRTTVSCRFILSWLACTSPAAAQQSTEARRSVTPADPVGTIEERLRAAAGLDARDIRVDWDDGIVVLTRSVPHLLARDRAVHIAASVRGVRAIDDNLVVEPVQRDDAEIERDVEEALERNATTESWRINAIVNEGRVTLEGVVESLAQQALAATVAKAVRGVREVENEIRVPLVARAPDDR